MSAILLALAGLACVTQALHIAGEQKPGNSTSNPHSLVELKQSQSSRARWEIPWPWSKKKKEKGATLTHEEIVDKLNAVPTFALVNGAGKIVPLGNADGSRDVCWFISAEEAKMLLELASADHPDEGLHLEVFPLGVAFQYADGWPTKHRAASGNSSFYLKVRGPRQEVEASEADLRAQLKAYDIDPGNWVLPVYSSPEFQSEGIMPLFFSPDDFVECWIAEGRSTDALPENLRGVDLRLLVSQMLNSKSLNWSIFEFVSSNEAYELSEKLLHPESDKEDVATSAGKEGEVPKELEASSATEETPEEPSASDCGCSLISENGKTFFVGVGFREEVTPDQIVKEGTSTYVLKDGEKIPCDDSRDAGPSMQTGKLILSFKEGVDHKDVMEKVKKLAMIHSTELLEGVGIGMVDVGDLPAAETELKKMEGVETVERDAEVGIA
mmetsp:Transcript_85486/g.147792  ORF Transcript_85486/g.147792 Transcript_85486/m.147792 type:complete len:440 (+) Transcript_85486:53-1372(+)